MTHQRLSSRVSLLPAVVAVLALALTGCVPESPDATPSPSPSASEPSAGEDAPLTVPPCADLLTRADIDRLVGPDAEASEIGEDQYLDGGLLPDAATTALGEASATYACAWAEPATDSGATAIIADSTAASVDALRDQLAADTTFETETTAGADVFSADEEEGLGYGYALVLIERVWIGVEGTDAAHAREVALTVLDALRAANPGLPASPPEPTETSSPAPSPAPSPSPSPTGSASPDDPDAAVLPECDRLLPLDTVRAVFGDDAEAIPAAGDPADHMPGPLAASTVRAAAQAEMCTWGIPFSDGGFSVVTAELTSDARSRLVRSLRSSSSYTERAVAGEPAFSYEAESELGSTTVVYVFVDTVWITVDGTLDLRSARQIAREAVEAVRLANS